MQYKNLFYPLNKDKIHYKTNSVGYNGLSASFCWNNKEFCDASMSFIFLKKSKTIFY